MKSGPVVKSNYVKWLTCAAVFALTVAACGGDATETTSATTAAPVEDWVPEYVDGVLQPLPDGYPDHALTIIVPDDATSSEGILSTMLQQVATKYSPVGIDIEIRADFESMPTWEALQFINESDEGKAGYLLMPYATVGSTADTVAADVEGITGQTLDDLQEIAGLEIGRWLMSQCATVAWEPTIEALVAETLARPGEVRYMGQGGGGGVDLGFFSTMKELGAGEVDAIPIGGTVEQATATAACEGDITNTTVEPILPHVQNGRVNLLMVNGDTRLDEFPDVPSALDLGIENSLQSGRQITTGIEVSADKLAWLFELFSQVVGDQEYIDLRQGFPGVEVGLENPEEADATNRRNVEIVTVILEDLGLVFQG